MKLLFCKVGLHWRMKIVESLFVDVVSGKTVYKAICPCNEYWMIDTLLGFPFFKVPLNYDEPHD